MSASPQEPSPAPWLEEIRAVVPGEIRETSVADVDYPLSTLTTGERAEVRVRTDAGTHRLVRKVARSVARSPMLAAIPPEHRAVLMDALPWRVEPDVYRSPMSSSLPEGMRQARCPAVIDLDDESAAIWLERVDHVPGPWSATDYRDAARMLGRFAGADPIGHIADAIGHPTGPHQARVYWQIKLCGMYLAAFDEGSVWSHPALLRTVTPALRRRLDAFIEQVPTLLTEIESLPLLVAHGDACPNNILRSVDGSGFIVIDWAFFGRNRVGFDLSQLVISEIDLGRMPGARLGELQDLCLPAYRAGLADGGVRITLPDLTRAHRIQLALAAAVASIPVERLTPDAVADPALEEYCRQRITALEHMLAAIDI
ncbi:phosphotransferase [Gordonia sp. VNK1]|uniref:phosphotransferase n=1 Tax=Gordonia oleivorans TaxID=3156618 RepID=UPI0032B4B3BF